MAASLSRDRGAGPPGTTGRLGQPGSNVRHPRIGALGRFTQVTSLIAHTESVFAPFIIVKKAAKLDLVQLKAMYHFPSSRLIAHIYLVLAFCSFAEASLKLLSETASEPALTSNATSEGAYVYPTDSMEPAAGICPGLGLSDIVLISHNTFSCVIFRKSCCGYCWFFGAWPNSSIHRNLKFTVQRPQVFFA